MAHLALGRVFMSYGRVLKSQPQNRFFVVNPLVEFSTHVMGWKFLIPPLSSWVLKKIIQLDSYTPLHIIIIQAHKPFLATNSPGCTNVQQHPHKTK